MLNSICAVFRRWWRARACFWWSDSWAAGDLLVKKIGHDAAVLWGGYEVVGLHATGFYGCGSLPAGTLYVDAYRLPHEWGVLCLHTDYERGDRVCDAVLCGEFIELASLSVQHDQVFEWRYEQEAWLAGYSGLLAESVNDAFWPCASRASPLQNS